MSIVPLARVTIIGPLAEKERLLRNLQALACVHLESLSAARGHALRSTSPSARRAFRFLAGATQRRHQSHSADGFDAEAIDRRALAIEERLHDLQEERRFLARRVGDLVAWGDFSLPEPAERLGLRLWFYIVPHYRMRRMPRACAPWQVVHRDNRFAYVAVLSADEPRGFPVERTHTGSVALSVLKARLEALEIEEDELQAERVALSRWLDLCAANIARLDDEAAVAVAATQTHDDDALFALSGWAPEARLPDLHKLAEDHCSALIAEPPSPDSVPPTLLVNRSLAASGGDLLSIYTTPAYGTWDPSSVLAGSFALFFGMILADAGYAMMLAAAVGLVWRPLGRSPALQRFRLLLLVLAAVSAAFGMVTGSYFGIAPPAGTALSRLRLIDTSNMLAMMELAIGVGVLHIVLANFIVARQERGLRRIAPIGWILGLLGGPALYLGEMHAVGGLLWAGYAFIAAGLVAIAGYSGVGRPPLGRAIDGLLALVKVPAAFGDVLSYLRLFALGYAGTSLAVAFNRLAADVAGQVPGFGLLLAGFILVLGHGLNFVLGVAGGFVHGLRLNFIEFFNWSLSAEGRPFRAFKKSEVVPSLR